MFAFDHLVIGAADLGQGGAWAEDIFGTAPPLGGAHLGLGTHNLLARMPHGYLEIIAADPDQDSPPRWMGLDNDALKARLSERPRPIAWALNVANLEEAAQAAPWEVSLLLEASRDDLSWRMGTPVDGRPAMGVLPFLIEWPESLGRKPPVRRMAPLGAEGREMALGSLRLKHPEPERVEALLRQIDAEQCAASAGFALEFHRSDTASIEAAFRPVRMNRSA